jgi:hypothetical protein
MSLLVDNPILNSPFEEPARYWAYEEGQPVLKESRLPAGYYLKDRTGGPQMVYWKKSSSHWKRLPSSSTSSGLSSG